MRREGVLQALRMALGLAFLTGLFVIAYFVSSRLYDLTGLHPAPLVSHLSTALLGMLLAILSVTVIGLYVRSKRISPQMQVFGPIIAALDRIAKGDFSIQLPDGRFHDHMVSELVNSVNNMAQQLNQIETMRQEFISNVSHEIQSPLTSIRGFARLLQNDALSAEERSHYLTVIETESTRLARVTDNLLRLASLEARQVQFEPKPYRLDRQIRDLLLACEPQWTAKALEMDVSLQEVTVTADDDLLSQVWINLIHNSIKFSRDEGTICIDLQRQGDAVVFTIVDTGAGIAEEDQPHIFERFYKVDKARSPSKEGSGLGLAIAKTIVEMHGGRIALDSRPGRGTTFTVTLPATR